MTEGDREEFDRTLGVLFAGIDKPLGEAAREAFWKGLQRMGLVELQRCADLLLRELEEHEGPPKRFSVADIWQAKKRLRAQAPRAAAPGDQQALAWDGDRWDMAANTRLLKHIVHALSTRPLRYGQHNSSPSGSPQMRETVKRLVAAKNAWAADMRDLDDQSAEGVRKDLQDRCWDDLIARAETGSAKAVA